MGGEEREREREGGDIGWADMMKANIGGFKYMQ